MNKITNHADLTIHHHFIVHFPSHVACLLAGKWQMSMNSHRWLEETLPEDSCSPKALLCATSLQHQTGTMHHNNTEMAHPGHADGGIARLARWQSCPHTARPGRNMIWKSSQLGPRAWPWACLGIYSTNVMRVWLIGTTIGAHVHRALYSTQQAAGTLGLEAPGLPPRLKGYIKQHE